MQFNLTKAAFITGLVICTSLCGCSDAARDAIDSGTLIDAAPRDTRAPEAESEAAIPDDRSDADASMDGALPREAGRANDAAANALDSSPDGQVAFLVGADQKALGPLVFTGPPFRAPTLPVQRVACDQGGTATVCVILEDRTLYCVDHYTSVNGPSDSSTRVSNNRDFVRITTTDNDTYTYYAIRADGSVAAFSALGIAPRPGEIVVSNFGTPGAQYLSAWGGSGSTGGRAAECGLRISGEIECADAGMPPSYPLGPYIQFAGFVAFLPQAYAGIRADGVLVTGPSPEGGTLFFDQERFEGLAMEQGPPFCAVAASGSVYCSLGSSGAAKFQLVRQPFSAVRDVARAGSHLCAVLADGKVQCRSEDGKASASAVPQDKRFVDIDTAGEFTTCGVTEDGELWCWGDRRVDTYQIPLPKKAATQ